MMSGVLEGVGPLGEQEMKYHGFILCLQILLDKLKSSPLDN